SVRECRKMRRFELSAPIAFRRSRFADHVVRDLAGVDPVTTFTRRNLSMPSAAAHFVSASLCYVLAFAAPESNAAEVPQKRRFEVRDSGEMAYFGTIWSSQRDHLREDGIVSPDGRHIVKVTHRGVLPEGMTEGTIWLFETKAVLDYINNASRPRPE